MAMAFPIDFATCLFIGALLALLAVAYFWFERSGASHSTREKTRREMRYRTPRLSPKVEDDEMRLKTTERPDDPTKESDWEDKL